MANYTIFGNEIYAKQYLLTEVSKVVLVIFTLFTLLTFLEDGINSFLKWWIWSITASSLLILMNNLFREMLLSLKFYNKKPKEIVIFYGKYPLFLHLFSVILATYFFHSAYFFAVELISSSMKFFVETFGIIFFGVAVFLLVMNLYKYALMVSK
ncbi:MAG: hypothetical protein R3B60_05075 [Candidatus Paceibacterota bacterium]